MGLALLRTAITGSLTLSEDVNVREVFSAQVSSSMLLFIGSQSSNLCALLPLPACQSQQG